MTWTKNRRNLITMHAQLGLPADKGRANKELVVYWVLPYLITWAIERVKPQFTCRMC